jgi:hypothetical protein
MLRRVALSLLVVGLGSALLLTACGREATAPEAFSPTVALSAAGEKAAPANFIDALNVNLASRDTRLAVARVETITMVGAENEVGRTLYASDRQLRLPYRWVPGDERRLADGDKITYLVDQSDGTANPSLPNAITEAAIDRAMETWDGAQCSNLQVLKRPDTGADPDIIDFLLGMGAPGDPFLADIVNAGFAPAAFFEALAPGGSSYIIAVTFTLIFVDDDGFPTDINHDHNLDTALKEVYYNNRFPWSVTGAGGVDVETIALHENGHSLELGHFGNIFVTENNSKLHVAPRAVMNAVYLGPMRELATSDQGAFCSTFGSWPNR